jgi:hypothetical protein
MLHFAGTVNRSAGRKIWVWYVPARPDSIPEPAPNGPLLVYQTPLGSGVSEVEGLDVGLGLGPS